MGIEQRDRRAIFGKIGKTGRVSHFERLGLRLHSLYSHYHVDASVRI